MRYGLNRHIQRHMVVSTVYATKDGIEKRDELWRAQRKRFTLKEIETLKQLTKLDHGNAAMIISITPLV